MFFSLRSVFVVTVVLGSPLLSQADDLYSYPGLEARAAAAPGDGVILVSTNPKVKGFKLEIHRQLSAMKTPECTTSIDRGHYLHDILLQTDSSLHFDNCNFDEGAVFLQSMAQVIREQGKAAKDDGSRRTALFSLGRALHTIQDFYAHSNYVEMMDKRPGAPATIELGPPRVANLGR